MSGPCRSARIQFWLIPSKPVHATSWLIFSLPPRLWLQSMGHLPAPFFAIHLLTQLPHPVVLPTHILRTGPPHILFAPLSGNLVQRCKQRLVDGLGSYGRISCRLRLWYSCTCCRLSAMLVFESYLDVQSLTDYCPEWYVPWKKRCFGAEASREHQISNTTLEPVTGDLQEGYTQCI